MLFFILVDLENTKSENLSGKPITRLLSEQVTQNVKEKITQNVKEQPKLPGTSGVYVTTKDSYTLTDGPTIFISNEIEKIAKFCIKACPFIFMRQTLLLSKYVNVASALSAVTSLLGDADFLRDAHKALADSKFESTGRRNTVFLKSQFVVAKSTALRQDASVLDLASVNFGQSAL